jgi:DNA-binding NarL/FixJ family response regulator
VELLRERPVGPRVVVLAEPGDDDSACDAARAGVSGWLPSGSSVEELTETVRLVHDGHGIYPSRLLATVLDGMRHDIAEARRPTGRLSALTEREVEVLRALVEGLSARDIADHLDVAVNTVRTHTHRIFRKLGVHGRLEAVRIARAERLAPLTEASELSGVTVGSTPSRPVRLVREREDDVGRIVDP